ncbi:NUDIX hydrolase [Mycolicibacterium thermoresistibile]|uniref:NTP pyrophosphohydrolase n=2 Tax=Mycolicibacterium thermoresistibile TaxID=1797 RepID=G7CFE6_MYCT3|nr:CoA pyrophosphatase [Mycolicibacterium thermoresistibile]EHI13225.1 NTP pyrophosphohydrolase [Mycolicibacterium thermoresistibile ATCC 19527]MCV7186962.1 CoA pyrophosphatase [Mycolicibacterium thermoresistibile]GAT13136.1 NUDIX hydrolase [Mycolicibacterium thermoresistibile]SNW20414.1 NUDIX hydrolase [Mycolicibacterium thermoresistibile]
MRWERERSRLAPDAAPPWLKQLVDNVDHIRRAYRRRLPAEVVSAILEADAEADRAAGRDTSGPAGKPKRDAAVLVLFSGPPDAPAGELPDDADLLLTVRASTLRHHAGQAAFPGGAADDTDPDPVYTALREAAEETGIDTARLQPLATMEKMFIPPSGFHVVPVLAYSPDPGPVGVVDPAEAALVSRIPVRAFVNPENRIMVHRDARTHRLAWPAFVLNEMLVWGFTGQVISAMLDVAGWARPWNTDDVRELDEAMALAGSPDRSPGRYGDAHDD